MSLDYYAHLLTDETRIAAFRHAIHAVVRPGDRVLDLGTGLGTFAFFAREAGAGSVWAVDCDPIVHVAEWIGLTNDVAHDIRFVRGRIPGAALSEPLDVLVFEDFPATLLNDETYRILRQIQLEILAPGARMVPRAGRLWLAPLGTDEMRRWLFPLDGLQDGLAFGIDWSAIRAYLRNGPRYTSLGSEVLIAEARPSPDIPLLPLPKASDLTIKGCWKAAEALVVHGLALWFELDLGGGQRITNAPGRKDAQPWGQVVLPLDPPLRVGPGTELFACVTRDPLADGAPGWMRWMAWSGSDEVRGHEFASMPAALEDLYDTQKKTPSSNGAATEGP